MHGPVVVLFVVLRFGVDMTDLLLYGRADFRSTIGFDRSPLAPKVQAVMTAPIDIYGLRRLRIATCDRWRCAWGSGLAFVDRWCTDVSDLAYLQAQFALEGRRHALSLHGSRGNPLENTCNAHFPTRRSKSGASSTGPFHDSPPEMVYVGQKFL